MAKNDAKILELKKQIAAKKSALKGIERFTPLTNCNLHVGNERFNLHACDSKMLTTLLVQLNALRLSAADLGLESFEISGFALSNWLSDIKSKLLILDKVKEEERLKVLEDQLTSLLSVEKKTELLIDELQGKI